MKILTKIMLFLSLILITVTAANAITVSSCSQFLDIKYYTIPDSITHYICLSNNNAYNATITMQPSSNIANMLTFEENPVVLNPGEQRFVPFTVDVTQQSTWEGLITLYFYVPEDNMPNGVWSVDARISQGTCTDGQTKTCYVGECEGMQTCFEGDFGECVKNDPECGICTEEWSCTEWTECQPGDFQTRNCVDLNDCGTIEHMPIESQVCAYEGPDFNYTDMTQKVESLELRVTVLEQDVSALQTLVNSLQQLIQNIQNTISNILVRLTALEEGYPTQEGCAYDNPSCESGYECVDNECVVIQDPPACTEEWSCTEWQPEICPIEEVQTRTCTDLSDCGTELTKPAETKSCVYEIPDKTVIFRTDVEDENYRYEAMGSWIVADCNQDGTLESYGGLGISRTSMVNSPIGHTPSGLPYQCFYGNTEVRIEDGSRDIIYKSSITSGGTPILSTTPVEPYASNNQEVYIE